jgi:hypothetical protein
VFFFIQITEYHISDDGYHINLSTVKTWVSEPAAADCQPRCVRSKKKRRIELDTPELGERRLERIFYQRVRRRAVLPFLLLCAGVAAVIHFEVQPLDPPVAPVAPTRRPLAAPTDDRPGHFKIVGIDGWTVKSIKNNHITLVLGDKEIELDASDQDTTRQGLSPSPGPPLARLSPIQPPSAETSDVRYRDPDAPPAAPPAVDPPSAGTADVQYHDPDAPETP